ncbi:hypothetical protein CEXT_307541 [Caerostris extrusa]|uniref:Uncharacterized protein n=1 Tax=Caerostris extrusa TaxID=172846 RepID=A0AAV4M372_CAEEX|nr:hypothetical protein CEXT_307541 [Caerostris extrusa]
MRSARLFPLGQTCNTQMVRSSYSKQAMADIDLQAAITLWTAGYLVSQNETYNNKHQSRKEQTIAIQIDAKQHHRNRMLDLVNRRIVFPDWLNNKEWAQMVPQNVVFK